MHSSTRQDQPATAASASRCCASGPAGAAPAAGALKQVYLRGARQARERARTAGGACVSCQLAPALGSARLPAGCCCSGQRRGAVTAAGARRQAACRARRQAACGQRHGGAPVALGGGDGVQARAHALAPDLPDGVLGHRHAVWEGCQAPACRGERWAAGAGAAMQAQVLLCAPSRELCTAAGGRRQRGLQGRARTCRRRIPSSWGAAPAAPRPQRSSRHPRPPAGPGAAAGSGACLAPCSRTLMC
jgi:hypothetical protein